MQTAIRSPARPSSSAFARTAIPMKPGFEYSEAMKANNVAWTTSSLDTYLADPRGDIHGVKMFFKGLPAAKDRSDVIAYLETLK